jgi:exopolysaccharide biosynthesis polyprenyl glycosylphosphotransferase
MPLAATGDATGALPLGRTGLRRGLRIGGVDLPLLRRLHVYTDVGLVGAGWLAAWAIRARLVGWLGEINGVDTYVQALPLIVPPWIASCWLFGIYQSARDGSFVDQIQALLRGVLLGFLVVCSIGFFSKELDFARTVVVLSAGLSLLLQGASRALFRRAEKRLRRSGRCDVRTLIVGAGTTGARLLQRMQDHPEAGYRVVGFLDDDPALAGERVANRPVLGGRADLRRVVRELAIREVVIAIPSLEHAEMLALVLDCEDLDIEFRVATDLFEVLTTSARVELIDDVPLVRLGGRRGTRGYRLAKRAFDVGGALLLLVASAPLFLWCALRIRLDSPGPVLFAQVRVGQGGRPFRMYKLRTMHTGVEPYREAPRERGDARVTRYGAWLRRTSLDELPQLWNVLRGEMSLVGPRPEMPFIVERYQEWQRRRLTVKPGITGLWQILGRKDLPMHENLQYDFYYIHNRSFLFDLSILIRTALAVGTGRGAF